MEIFYSMPNLQNHSEILGLLEENQVFVHAQPSSQNKFIKIINEKLSSALTRYEGVLYINFLYDQFSTEIIVENLNLWLGHIIREFESKDQSKLVCLFTVLNKFIKTSSAVSEIHKLMASGTILKILDVTMRQFESIVRKVALHCLELIIKYFSGPCGQQKNKIEKFLYSFIDSSDNELIIGVARCLVFLQQVSGGGVKGINHKTQWQNQLERLTQTAQFYLNELFISLSEINAGDEILLEPLQFPSLNKDSHTLYLNNLNIRICNILVLIETMLRQPFSVSKMINVEKIIEILNRGFDINPTHFIHKPNLAMLKLIIPNIHKYLFLMLDGLIQCVHKNLLPYAVLINSYFSKTLQWTKQHENAHVSFYSLRLTIYDVMASWFVTAKAGCAIEFFSEEIFKVLLNDVVPSKNEMALSVHHGPVKHLSKKARKQFNREKATTTTTNSNPTKVVEFSNAKLENLCQGALRVIQTMIKSSGALISAREHRTLQEFVIEILIDTNKTRSTPMYCTNSQCLLELYKTLLVLVLRPNSLESPPLSYAYKAFALGKCTRNRRISELCSDALSQLEKIIHPIGPSLQLPVVMNNRELANDLIEETIIEPIEDKKDFDTSFNLSVTTSVESPEKLNDEENESVPIAISSDEDEEMIDLSPSDRVIQTNGIDKDYEALREVEMHEKEIHFIDAIEKQGKIDSIEIVNGQSDANIETIETINDDDDDDEEKKINGIASNDNENDDNADEMLFSSFISVPIRDNL